MDRRRGAKEEDGGMKEIKLCFERKTSAAWSERLLLHSCGARVIIADIPGSRQGGGDEAM